jgi:hypothetical protein
MTTILSADGLLEIPEAFREVDAIKPGQRCDIQRLGQGEYRVSVEVPSNENPADLVAWLFACPEKDWWVEPDCRERSVLKPSNLFEE